MDQNILNEIKKNKKYKTISEEIIKNEIENYLKLNSNKSNKQIVKDIRAKLHKTYSVFQTKKKKKIEKLLEELKQTKSQEIIDKLLSSVLSTKERLNDYQIIYKNIFKITGKPRTIVDLGAGLNSFSINYMDLKKINYYSYDIDEQDKKILNKFFKRRNFS